MRDLTEIEKELEALRKEYDTTKKAKDAELVKEKDKRKKEIQKLVDAYVEDYGYLDLNLSGTHFKSIDVPSFMEQMWGE